MDIASLRQQFDSDLAAARAEADLRARPRQVSVAQERAGLGLHEDGRRPRRPSSGPALGQAANEFKAARRDRDRGAAGSRDARRGRPATRSTSRCPAALRCVGHRHPLTLLRERVEAIFLRLGFLIVEGPELEDDYHNFEALNMPAEHPARDMQDTLYLAAPVPARRPFDGLGAGAPRRCCARTPRACRSATWRRTSRRSG